MRRRFAAVLFSVCALFTGPSPALAASETIVAGQIFDGRGPARERADELPGQHLQCPSAD